MTRDEKKKRHEQVKRIRELFEKFLGACPYSDAELDSDVLWQDFADALVERYGSLQRAGQAVFERAQKAGNVELAFEQLRDLAFGYTRAIADRRFSYAHFLLTLLKLLGPEAWDWCYQKALEQDKTDLAARVSHFRELYEEARNLLTDKQSESASPSVH